MGKKSSGETRAVIRSGMAVQAKPMFDQAYALHQSGQFAQAEVMYQTLLQAHPRNFDGLRAYGLLAHQTNRPQLAVRLFTQALEVKPKSDQIYFDIGCVYQTLNLLPDALVNYDKAIALRLSFVEAFYNRGVVLRSLHLLNEALASFNKVLALKPNYADAHIYRGLVLMEMRYPAEALISYDKAIQLKPQAFEGHCNRALALLDLQRQEEALLSFDKAISLRPNLLEDDNSFLFGDFLHAKMTVCDWQGLGENLKKLEAGIQASRKVAIPFIVLSLLDVPAINKQAAEIYTQSRFPPSKRLGSITRQQNKQKIRLGYYSADFYNHATSYLIAGLFESHDRTQFELFGFSFEPNKQDEMERRIASAFDHYVNVSDKTDLEVAQYSRELGIDIAIDLKGFTKNARTGIFAERCAPVQVSYLGYPGTMAAEYMDYIVADRVVIPPEAVSDYKEKVVYLPHSYQVNDSTRRISDRVFSRQECGLPASGFVFCCFNNSFKLMPSIFNVWMRVLNAVNGGVLWLLEGNASVVKNLRMAAEAQGVDGERLVFAKRMPLDDHLARHHLADLFLDTLPYNAHTTASDALWAGLPVLTCAGESFASRVSASLLHAVGLPELVTLNQGDYEQKAVELATNRIQLSELKERLKKNIGTAPLFNTQLFAGHIESAYKTMCRRYEKGLPPDVIEIS